MEHYQSALDKIRRFTFGSWTPDELGAIQLALELAIAHLNLPVMASEAVDE